ncbi:MAG: ATP-binding protein [Spirochaetales bacterium]|nr:ATP-binding protein [Spirochaetales bacterium]
MIGLTTAESRQKFMEDTVLFRKQYVISADDPLTFGEASSDIKKTLKQLGVPPDVIRRAAVSMYEAEINTIIHGGGGEGEVFIYAGRVKIVFRDQGPGIPDIEKAMQPGFSTASEKAREMGFGAGLGLPNIKKNSDEFTIESEPGKGTTVTIIVRL